MEKREYCAALATALDQFVGDIKAVLEHHELAKTPDHLNKIADELLSLNQKSLEVLRSHDPDIEDIGAIVQDILTQPINGQTKKESTSMIQSAEAFKAKPSAETIFTTVLSNYIRYAYATRSLIHELELLSDELKKNAA